MITLTCSGKKETKHDGFYERTHLAIHHQRSKYGSTITTNHSAAVFSPASYAINATQMSASFSTCVHQRSRYQNVIHFRMINGLPSQLNMFVYSQYKRYYLHASQFECSRAMTHRLGPAYVQRTKQQRDNPKKNVSKVVRMTGQILGSHDLRVRLMGHDTLQICSLHVSAECADPMFRAEDNQVSTSVRFQQTLQGHIPEESVTLV